MFRTKVVEKIEKKHILCSVTFFSCKSCHLRYEMEKYGTARQATDDKIMLRRNDSIFMPDN